MDKYLSKLIIGPQKLVLIIDRSQQEKLANNYICQFLREQCQGISTIKKFKLSSELNSEDAFIKFVQECNEHEPWKWNVLLPPLSDLLCYQRPAVIFQFLIKLRNVSRIKQIFLWATPDHIVQSHADYIIAAIEWLSDLVLRLHSKSALSIIICKRPGGGVTKANYDYHLVANHIELRQNTKRAAIMNQQKQSDDDSSSNSEVNEQLSTFKIELEEDELMARNALIMPYEKSNTDGNNEGGKVIYVPEANDDFDEEDPDDDLLI